MDIDIDSNQAMLLKENRPVRTQFLIFTLFGDYVLHREGRVWTRSLLKLMELLGMTDQAIRSALSRMTRKGWITSKRHGRRSEILLTERGRNLLERGRFRIFEEAYSEWDGQWYLVIYSLPEENRKLRHVLRNQLAWLGFGQLAPGTWISPHNRGPALQAVINEMDASKFVDMFTGVYMGPSQAEDLIQRSWNLEALADQYRDFTLRYDMEFREALRRINGQDGFSAEESFVRRFWLTHDFQSFPLRDPNLPLDLLPSNWVGTTARQLFENYHRLLGNFAEQFVEEIIEQQD